MIAPKTVTKTSMIPRIILKIVSITVATIATIKMNVLDMICQIVWNIGATSVTIGVKNLTTPATAPPIISVTLPIAPPITPTISPIEPAILPTT